MFIRALLFILIISIFFSSGCQANQNNSIVKEFVEEVLDKKRIPQLFDFYLFFGKGNELELEFEMKHCIKMGWKPPENHPNCIDYIKERYSKAKEVNSLFLNWLRQQLPLSPKIKILDSKKFVGTIYMDHEIIDVKLNETYVSFYRPLGKGEIRVFGKLSIAKINNIPIDKILKKVKE